MSDFTCGLLLLTLLLIGVAGQSTLNRIIRLERRVKELEERNAE